MYLYSSENDFKESRKTAFFYMIWKQKISIFSYCDLFRVVIFIARHALVSFVPFTEVSADLPESG